VGSARSPRAADLLRFALGLALSDPAFLLDGRIRPSWLRDGLGLSKGELLQDASRSRRETKVTGRYRTCHVGEEIQKIGFASNPCLIDLCAEAMGCCGKQEDRTHSPPWAGHGKKCPLSGHAEKDSPDAVQCTVSDLIPERNETDVRNLFDGESENPPHTSCPAQNCEPENSCDKRRSRVYSCRRGRLRYGSLASFSGHLPHSNLMART